MLARHPRVDRVIEKDSPGITFSQGVWNREIRVGQPEQQYYGLFEVIDNNPLVCADVVSVPGAAATLGLIAIAPLAQAGLIADSPVLAINFADNEDELHQALSRVGWDGGIAVHVDEFDLGGVLAATGMVSIRTPDNLDDLDALYEEQFGRSFYIRRDDSSDWRPELVLGQPYAVYRLRIVPDSPNSLLTIAVLSDRNGKAGGAQLVHALNVMCGFEESLGVS